ncbi:citrate transporter [uncultured Parasutterella sp.]|uniref:citrate transporter n=2 Tax=uncultured Parasutterella sp. TaxID=1263098 RepID=UPI002593C959|nr:citrate transporter [uncultured Parasutterella sp.]
MTGVILAQIVVVVTLILMIIGKTPMYITAVVGSTVAALLAGIPLYGADPVTIKGLLIGGLNPVLIDMGGILLFIGIMQSTGFLHVIIGDIIKAGNYIGGGPGIITAAAAVAGGIGMMVGFTQAAITGVVAGPAAIKLGVDRNEAAGALQHANILGCGAGFSHPTVVGILAISGIGYGMVNVWGLVVAAAVMSIAWYRMRTHVRKEGFVKKMSAEEIKQLLDKFNKDKKANVSSWIAFTPFIILIVAASSGAPIFIVCFFCALLTSLLARRDLQKSQGEMIEGVRMIAVPFIATIVFLFMSGVIKNTGFVDTIAKFFEPLLAYSPELLMFLISIITGIITQSLAASSAILLPFLSVVLTAGADPMASSVAAIAGANIGQYYLTGGPVSGLNTVIPVVPGSDLVKANLFQRPNYLFGFVVAGCIVAALTFL